MAHNTNSADFLALLNARLNTAATERRDHNMRTRQNKAERLLYQQWIDGMLEFDPFDEGIPADRVHAAKQSIREFVRGAYGRNYLSHHTVAQVVQRFDWRDWSWSHDYDVALMEMAEAEIDDSYADCSDGYDPLYGAACYGVEGGDAPWITEPEPESDDVLLCMCGKPSGGNGLCPDCRNAFPTLEDAYVPASPIPMFDRSALAQAFANEFVGDDEIPF